MKMLLLERNIYVGVPQGSVLGPLIFLLYRTYLPDRIESICKIFPDDTSLFSIFSNDVVPKYLALNSSKQVTKIFFHENIH